MVRFDRIGVSDPGPSNGVVGVDGAGVLEDDLEAEGNDIVQRTC